MNSRNSLQLEGLSRIVQHNEKYDCAMISGYIAGEDVSRKEQKQRHAKLLVELKLYDYFIVSLRGGWENDNGEVEKEQRFFVINRGSKKKSQPEEIEPIERFTEIIVELGKKYEQEVVVIVPRGALSEESKAHFISPKTNKKNHMGKARLRRITGGMYSRVKERSFKFGEEIKNDVEILAVHYPVGTMFGVMGCRAKAKKENEDFPSAFINGTSLREWIIDRHGDVYKKSLRKDGNNE